MANGQAVKKARATEAVSVAIETELDLQRGQFVSSTPLLSSDQSKSFGFRRKRPGRRRYLLKAGSR